MEEIIIIIFISIFIISYIFAFDTSPISVVSVVLWSNYIIIIIIFFAKVRQIILNAVNFPLRVYNLTYIGDWRSKQSDI